MANTFGSAVSAPMSTCRLCYIFQDHDQIKPSCLHATASYLVSLPSIANVFQILICSNVHLQNMGRFSTTPANLLSSCLHATAPHLVKLEGRAKFNIHCAEIFLLIKCCGCHCLANDDMPDVPWDLLMCSDAMPAKPECESKMVDFKIAHQKTLSAGSSL